MDTVTPLGVADAFVSHVFSKPDCRLEYIYIYIGVGKGGTASCTVVPVAPCVGLRHGLLVGLFTCRTSCHANLPTKPPFASEPGYIPLNEVDGWTCFKVEIGQPLVCP